MGFGFNVNIMATLIFRRALCYGISELIPYDASMMCFNLVEMDGVFGKLDVVNDGFWEELGMFMPFPALWVVEDAISYMQ